MTTSTARQHAALLSTAQMHDGLEQAALRKLDWEQAQHHRSRAIALRRKAAALFDKNFSTEGKHSLDIQK